MKMVKKVKKNPDSQPWYSYEMVAQNLLRTCEVDLKNKTQLNNWYLTNTFNNSNYQYQSTHILSYNLI